MGMGRVQGNGAELVKSDSVRRGIPCEPVCSIVRLSSLPGGLFLSPICYSGISLVVREIVKRRFTHAPL